MENKYNIKLAQTDKEIEQIAKCAEITWHDAYDNLLPDGQVDYMIEKYQSFYVLKNDIKNNGYVYYIIQEDDDVIAFCGIRPENDKLFISKIYVDPKYQRKGLATKLFNKVLIEYRDDYKLFYLTVNKNNTKAISAYKSFGFTITDSTKTDIGNNYVMDDYIMTYNN